jgi:hypothetical protein
MRKESEAMKQLLLSTIVLGLLSQALQGQMHAPVQPSGCSAHAVSYQGWDAQEVTNPWVKLTFVPKLGGRLMQVEFNGHPYLFVNPKYRGQYISPEEAKGGWINYGGDKIWPMPEGNSDDHHWVLASTAIDDLPYDFKILAQGEHCVVQLTGQPDPITGLQYERTISISADSPQINFHAVMKNATAHPIEWSVQSVSQYDLSDPKNRADYNHELWALTPISPNSTYPDGYHVRSGLAEDPSFSVADNIFQLHWMYFENEVWVDSQAGWLTVFDKESQYGMVERFSFQADGKYPGNATVIFYKNGPSVNFDKQGRASIAVPTLATTPYYMEAEVNSPMVNLPPGGTYAMDTVWNPVRMSDPPRSVTASGLVTQRLHATLNGDAVTFTASVTPFGNGTITALLFNKDGSEVGRRVLMQASPNDSLVLNETMPLPSGAAHLKLALFDGHGSQRGVLDEVQFDGQRSGSK